MQIKVNPDDAKLIFGRLTKACAANDSRPVLKAVHLEIEGDKLTAVCLNGWLLAQYTCQCVPENGQDRIEMNVLPDKLARFSPVGMLTLSDEIPGFLQISDGQQRQLMRLSDEQYIAWSKIAHAPGEDPEPQAVRRICFTADLLKTVCEIAGKGSSNLRMKIGDALQGVWCGTDEGVRMLVLPARCPDTDEYWSF